MDGTITGKHFWVKIYMAKYKVPICPSCGKPLKKVAFNDHDTYEYDETTGRYSSKGGDAETCCLECDADIYEVTPDGPVNYQGETSDVK